MTVNHTPPTAADSRYRYRLGRLVAVCPQCGRREFKPYLDADGRVLDPTVGRCNREIRCAYHLRPRDFFAANPDRKPRLPDIPPRPATDFMPLSLVGRSFAISPSPDNLTRYFLTLFPEERVREVFRLYNVGQTKLYPGGTMFWFIDAMMRVRTGKAMAYGPDGHRLRDRTSASISYVHGLWRHGFRCSLCYFGEHVAANFPAATLLLVESEKTALYLACLAGIDGLERYVPLAVGGCSNLSYDPFRAGDDDYRGRVVQNRDVILLPDADATGKWSSLVPQLERAAASVRLLDLRHLAAGKTDDIMDIHLRRRQSRKQRHPHGRRHIPAPFSCPEDFFTYLEEEPPF